MWARVATWASTQSTPSSPRWGLFLSVDWFALQADGRVGPEDGQQGGVDGVMRSRREEWQQLPSVTHVGPPTAALPCPPATTLVSQVSGGNGEQVISRDVHRLCTQFDFFRLLSFYHSGAAVLGCS